ncbi:hypothetical protein CYMTET_30860 [Cymbomonas tetramitiformis]|uniref:Uncharacterized protein n=1 Tax=Cymbomonas tetramitiformis TaxID=36881 RepID=A0AAE0FI90_9CHLO|nr:hypothetical protein CYMTET_30860 [Cymbomonas tetramitiformis]
MLPEPFNPLKAPPALLDGTQIGDCWVLKPKTQSPRGVVHFLGGAFIGASPVVGYASIIEALADAGFIVVTTPFNLTFDHRACALRVADSLTRGLKTLEINPDGSQESAKDDADEGFQTLPLYAMGHSNGALLQLLMSSLEECQDLATVHVQRAVLLSYNNKPVSEAVPGGVPPQVSSSMSEARPARHDDKRTYKPVARPHA